MNTINSVITYIYQLNFRHRILLFLFIIFLIILCCFYESVENFNSIGLHPSCDKYKTIDDCLNHDNCGMCMNNNKVKCVTGDNNGPLYTGGCDRWIYFNKNNLGKDKEKVLIDGTMAPDIYKGTKYSSRASMQNLH